MRHGDTEAEFSGSTYTLTVQILDSGATPDAVNNYRVHVSTINNYHVHVSTIKYMSDIFKLHLCLTRVDLQKWLFVVYFPCKFLINSDYISQIFRISPANVVTQCQVLKFDK